MLSSALTCPYCIVPEKIIKEFSVTKTYCLNNEEDVG
jgi:hypothetical protein